MPISNSSDIHAGDILVHDKTGEEMIVLMISGDKRFGLRTPTDTGGGWKFRGLINEDMLLSHFTKK